MSRVWVSLIIMTGFVLQVISFSGCSRAEVKKTTEAVAEDSDDATQGVKKSNKSPRKPASSQEILSNETVEYLKGAGKKVEKIFEPSSNK